MKRNYVCEISWCQSSIDLHVTLAVNDQSKIDVEIHRIGGITHSTQLYGDGGRVSKPAIVGPYINIRYIVDPVTDFDHIAIAHRGIAIANVKVIPCRVVLASFRITIYTLIQGRDLDLGTWSNNRHVPVSMSLPVPANPTPLPSPSPPEFVIDPELSVWLPLTPSPT